MTRGESYSAGSLNRFRISSLLLTVALIGGCLAVGRAAPLLGVALALVAAPAYIRTALAPRAVSRYATKTVSATQPVAHPDPSSANEPVATRPPATDRYSAIGYVLVFAESVALFTLLAITTIATFAAILAVFLTAGVLLERFCEPFARGSLLVCLISGLSLAAVTAFGLSGWLGMRLWPVRISSPAPRH